MQKSTTHLKNIETKTITLDAKDQVLGRFATQVANKLRGKDKATFSYHQVSGDKVIVVNAKQIRVTGQKLEDKKYYSHSGYLGSLKTCTLKELMEKNPELVIKKAVAGMLPKNRLQAAYLKNLTIYSGNQPGDK